MQQSVKIELILTFKPWSIFAFRKKGHTFLYKNEIENIMHLNELLTKLSVPHLDDLVKFVEAIFKKAI